MTTDSSDSHRKHRCSPSADHSPRISKRHKHRHHHRRHRRKSSKRDALRNDENEPQHNPDDSISAKPSDYDVEEGEILEDGEIPVEEGLIDDKKLAPPSDVESGELHDCDTRDGVAIEYDNGENEDLRRDPRQEDSLVLENGDSRKKSKKDESRSRRRSKSPLRGSSKYKDKRRSESKQRNLELMDIDGGQNGNRKNSHSYEDRDVCDRAKDCSTSLGRYHLETSDRSRSKSPDRIRDRERSKSVVDEGRSTRHNLYERDDGEYDYGNVDDEDRERDSRVRTDYRVDRGEKIKDKRRERSSSRHRSSKHEEGGSWDREREEMILREKRVKEREPRRDRNYRDWEYEQDRLRERNRGREPRQEQTRGRSRERDQERERRREASISSYRNNDRDVDRGRNMDRKLELDRERDKYGARNRHNDLTDRTRRHKYDDYDNGHDIKDKRRVYDEPEYRRDRNRKHESGNDRGAKDDSQKEIEDALKRADDDQKGYQERVELELAEQEEDDVDRIKEESRRRREAILQKYRVKQSQQVVPQDHKVSDEGPQEQLSQKFVSPSASRNVINDEKSDSQQGSEADKTSDVGMSPLRNETTVVEKSTVTGGLGEGSPKSERSNDMFCDDIFGDSPAGVRKKIKGDGLPVERSDLHDNWDDPEGYYSFRLGEILDGRYEVTAAHGKGVFSTVVRAKDLKPGTGDPEEVAIKIIRNNETMLKAGTEELVILKELVRADPNDRKHCVRYLSNFMFRNHLCIVFESLHMNLREVLKKFGRNIGLKLTAVQTYAKQLFIALKHLRKCGVLHSDIKPDNMLVNEAKNVLKLCDFGNAMFSGKNEITPYLVSRFYRAPEIILGLPYDHPMDIWSVGCCLYELYTGKVLFPGATNNDMLRLHMELKGFFPKKMLRKGAFSEQHFDQDLNFLATEEDPVTKKAIRRVMHNIRPKDIGTIIKGSVGEDPKMLANFKDLMDKTFVLDPDKRITVEQALSHPFITGK